MSDSTLTPRDETEVPSKHTPGPWGWYSEDASMATLCGVDENGNIDPVTRHVLSSTICKSCSAGEAHWAWGRCYTATAPNARLIAAAPDLLAALQRAENHFRMLSPEMDAPGSVMAEMRAAIAKATQSSQPEAKHPHD